MPATAKYDLEERTLAFAKNVNAFIKDLRKTAGNTEYIRQLIRSSGSVGANYIEANESLGKKDFLFHIKICRKEAKETQYWLQLLDCEREECGRRNDLKGEAQQLMKIFGAILEKCKSKQ